MMRPWWQEPAFWRDLGPFLFPHTSLDRATDDAADVIEWLGLADAPEEDAPRRRVLDAGCGVGRLTIPLAQHGCEVIGVDAIDEYRREARRRCQVAGVEVDIRAHDFIAGGPLLNAGRFDAILCSFALIGYHDDPVNDILLVRGFRELLAPGGRLVIITRHPEGTYGRLRHSSLDGSSLIEERRFDRENHIQHTTWTVMRGGRQRVHRSTLRIYSAADLKGLLEFCGFDTARVVDNRTDQFIVSIGAVAGERADAGA